MKLTQVDKVDGNDVDCKIKNSATWICSHLMLPKFISIFIFTAKLEFEGYLKVTNMNRFTSAMSESNEIQSHSKDVCSPVHKGVHTFHTSIVFNKEEVTKCSICYYSVARWLIQLNHVRPLSVQYVVNAAVLATLCSDYLEAADTPRWYCGVVC
ncbi:hypothetical protein Tco_0766138 [Tanacetum coccineum]